MLRTACPGGRSNTLYQSHLDGYGLPLKSVVIYHVRCCEHIANTCHVVSSVWYKIGSKQDNIRCKIVVEATSTLLQ